MGQILSLTFKQGHKISRSQICNISLCLVALQVADRCDRFLSIMAPPAYGSYAIDNMQDVGGMGFVPGDKHALTTDTVDAPLSVAIKKSGKPVKHWE